MLLLSRRQLLKFIACKRGFLCENFFKLYNLCLGFMLGMILSFLNYILLVLWLSNHHKFLQKMTLLYVFIKVKETIWKYWLSFASCLLEHAFNAKDTVGFCFSAKFISNCFVLPILFLITKFTPMGSHRAELEQTLKWTENL